MGLERKEEKETGEEARIVREEGWNTNTHTDTHRHPTELTGIPAHQQLDQGVTRALERAAPRPTLLSIPRTLKAE